MNSSAFTLVPGGAKLDRSLGFTARFVQVTNFTSSFVRLLDCPPDLPPFVSGAVVALPPGLRQARAVLVPTTPAAVGPPVPADEATLTWTDDELTPGAGHLLSATATHLQAIIGTIETVGNGDTVSQTFPVPSGTLGIQFIASSAGSFVLPAQVTVRGDVTQDNYIAGVGPGPATAADMSRWIPPDENAICSVTSQAGPGAPCRVTFVALTFCPTLNVKAPFSIPLALTAAPWQAPNQPPMLIQAAILANGTSVLVPAVAGQQVWVFACNVWIDAAAGNGDLTMQDTAGNGRHQFGTSLAGVQNPFASGGQGAPIGALGTGVQLKAGGNPITVRGSLVYSQA